MSSDTFTALLTELAPTVTALVTRRGFNVCDYAGADAASVAQARSELAASLGVTVERLYVPRQTHSAVVASPGQDLYGVDALVTDRPGHALVINTADCLPLLLADPHAGVIGAAHCGWRGTVAGIARATVARMVELGAAPGRIHAAMGPCICTDCFEVGEEVASQFPPEAVVRRPGVKPHVDLAEAVAMQLRALGVNRISQPVACSMHTAGFHSVRREGRDLPLRTASAIVMK